MFEWDKNKAAVNLNKHGISFDEASSCFMDPEALLLHDIAHSKIEDRYIAIAKSARRRWLVP